LGTFLADPLDVPWELVTFLADQLEVGDASVVKSYGERSKTAHEHQWEIADAFGYRPFANVVAQRELRTFLAARAWTSSEGPLRLFERASAFLRESKVLLPGSEAPRVWYRVSFHGRVGSCQHRGSIRTSCVSGRSGWSRRRWPRTARCR
jgi:hypothetical protein